MSSPLGKNTCTSASGCPVRVAIDEIRGGLSEDDAFLISVTGGALSSSFDEGIQSNDDYIVCDNVDYYVTTRKLEFARAELNYNAELIKLSQLIAKSMTPKVKTFGELWQHITKQLQKNYIKEKFVAVVERIHYIEQLVATATSMNRAGESLSLPTIIFDNNDLAGIQYKPNVLHQIIEKILSYFRELNINTILQSPIKPISSTIIAGLDKQIPTIEYPPTTVLIQPVDVATARKRFNQEMIVAQYIQGMEKMQCAACRLLDNILVVTNVKANFHPTTSYIPSSRHRSA